MEKNKSIDGLVPRDAKKTSAPKKAASPKAKKSAPKKTIKVAGPTDVKVKKEAKPTAGVTEDFLKPVQVFDFDENSGELKATDEKVSKKVKKQKKKKEKKPVSKKRKIITGILLFIVLILLGGGIWFVLWGNDIIAKITGGQGNIFDLFSEKYEPLDTDENGRTNILAFGTSGYNMEGEEGNGIHDGAQLTDSIMIISLDQETGDVAMVSLPRDLKASPTCTSTGKINEVYWCNNMDGESEQAGAEALMTEVGTILGIDFQYYAHVNWGSLVSIVDTLGGIEVTVDEDIRDYYYFDAGNTYTLDGEKALWLARIRHGTAHGDFTRAASQQKILIGIKDKILEKNLSITDLMSLASTLGDNLRTNFSIDEMKTLAHITSSFDFNNMRQISLIEPVRLMTTGTINGISYVLPSAGVGNYGAIQEYIAEKLSSDPRIYEDASILVLNGTSVTGLASTEQEALIEDGYQNIAVADAPEGNYEQKYTLYAITDTAPGTKELLEEKYSLTAKTLTDLPEGIDSSYDFILILGGVDAADN